LLVFARTERKPLPVEGYSGGPIDTAFLPELRSALALDLAASQSSGRIAMAAPYFRVDQHDRVMRNWDMFRVVCSRAASSAVGGWMRVVPSVQLVVDAHRNGVLGDVVAPTAGAVPLATPCRPFPVGGEVSLTAEQARRLSDDLGSRLFSKGCGEAASRLPCGFLQAYWQRVSGAYGERLPSGERLAGVPVGDSLGNRVVFRYRDALTHTPVVNDELLTPGSVYRYSAEQLLQNAASGAMVGPAKIFAGRVVVIGQTHEHAGDRFHTPLGEMSGAVVLVNAIDSMHHYRLLQPVSTTVSLLIALGLIIAVGYGFARWESLVGTLFATVVVVAVAGVASFLLFQRGVWLDFAAPIIGIQLHRAWAGFEEKRELARRRMQGEVVPSQ
jgi:hypothetical protein